MMGIVMRILVMMGIMTMGIVDCYGRLGMVFGLTDSRD
jgi:hypothetical protein